MLLAQDHRVRKAPSQMEIQAMGFSRERWGPWAPLSSLLALNLKSSCLRHPSAIPGGGHHTKHRPLGLRAGKLTYPKASSLRLIASLLLFCEMEEDLSQLGT